MDHPKCRNCGTPNTQNFCSNCGEQRYKRIVMKDVVGDFLSNLLAVEGPILKTAKDLTIRPGKMINDYLKGKRKEYYKPFQYYLLATTVYFIFFFIWGDEMLAMFSVMGADANTYGTADEIKTFQQKISTFQSDNMQLLTFLQIPIYAWLIWLFFKRKSGHSFTETLVASLYILGQMLMFGIISTLFAYINPKLTFIVSIVFTLLYLPWVLMEIYQENKFITLLKSWGIIALSFIIFGLLMGIIGVIWIFIIQLT